MIVEPIKPECYLCKKPVDTLRTEIVPLQTREILKVTASCHGEEETIEIDLEEIYRDNPLGTIRIDTAFLPQKKTEPPMQLYDPGETP